MAHNIFKMSFNKIYLMYIDKIERKGRTREELDIVICWLTGHSKESLKNQLETEVSVEDFIIGFPCLNEKAGLISGSICGYKVEEITDPLMQKVRYLDKLVDELSKGKPIDKILRN